MLRPACRVCTVSSSLLIFGTFCDDSWRLCFWLAVGRMGISKPDAILGCRVEQFEITFGEFSTRFMSLAAAKSKLIRMPWFRWFKWCVFGVSPLKFSRQVVPLPKLYSIKSRLNVPELDSSRIIWHPSSAVRPREAFSLRITFFFKSIWFD